MAGSTDALDPELAADLAQPRAHALDPSAAAGVETLQTHISHLFLTGERVYKLRKAVDLGFLRFHTRAARNADCLREVALNRRLAPDVYLGLAPLRRTPAGWQVGAVAEQLAPAEAGGEPPEHCVVMRRLPAARDALSLLAADRLHGAQIDSVGEHVARFHAAQRLGQSELPDPATWLAGLEAPVAANFRSLRTTQLPELEPERVAHLERAAREALQAKAACFETRRAAGRLVDGHGDLHLQHIWFEAESGPPLLIDCIEFDDALRRIDAASEVAFLAMDLAYRGRPGLAERFLWVYAAEADDHDLYRVVDWYGSYRAGVRAKVAALAAVDAAIAPEQRSAAAASVLRHLALAEAFLAPPARGALVLMCGGIGTGKSSVARELAEACGGTVISSDRSRKRAAGLRSDERAAAELYDDAHKQAVYDGLLERAGPVVDSGRTALLDARYALRRHRDAARHWARERDVPVQLIEVVCAEARVRERLALRHAAGRDPSDAGPELLAWSRATYEAPEEWPSATRLRLETDREDWREALCSLAEGLASRWHPSCKSTR